MKFIRNLQKMPHILRECLLTAGGSHVVHAPGHRQRSLHSRRNGVVDAYLTQQQDADGRIHACTWRSDVFA